MKNYNFKKSLLTKMKHQAIAQQLDKQIEKLDLKRAVLGDNTDLSKTKKEKK